jgi:hypothetical protein
MNYQDMTVEILDAATRTADDKRIGSFKVRVLSSPAGEMSAADAVAVEYDDKDLQSALGKLDRRELDAAGLTALGRTLAVLLLPTTAQGGGASVRELFARSLVKLGADAGLRLRLRLPSDLAVIPWEYAYVERAGGGGMDGFLALDPRIAIVRHEALAAPAAEPALSGDIKIVAALAQAEGLPELDLDEEMQSLTAALDGVAGIRVEPCRQATLQTLQPLLPGAGVFHFAGHGDFTRKMGARPGTYTGTGFLAFGDERVDAEQMGINLRGQGVRLAVLAGCNTGRRDGVSVWSGIAPALVKAEIPAVVANQYKILDKCAVAFSRQFYQALAGGLPIEQAVSAGRIAAYNADKTGRDWGVPVLYLRAADGQLFVGAADPQTRDRCRRAAEADVQVRAKEVKAGGIVVGAEVERMLAGKLAVTVEVAGKVLGKVVGLDIDDVFGGSTSARVDVDEVGDGGAVIGAKIGTFGLDPFEPPPPKKSKPPRPREAAAAPPPAAPEMSGAEPDEARPKASASFSTTASVEVDSVTGGQVIGTQVNRREGDTIQGNQVNVAAGGQASVNTAFGGPVHIAGPVTIVQGPTGPSPGAAATPAAPEPSIEEKLRLDVALPKTAVVNEPFDLVIAIRQPDAPVLAVADLDQVVSAEGSVFRNEAHDVVKYRIEVAGAGFEVAPPSYLIELRPGSNSRPVAFQVTSSKTGKRSLRVNAYQEDGVLAAQTRLIIDVAVSVAPG